MQFPQYWMWMAVLLTLMLTSSVLYSVASSFSSKFGRHDFKDLPFWQTKTFETRNPKMQCTARWSFPMGKLFSHQLLSKMACESPMIKSICTRAPSKPRRQVQESCFFFPSHLFGRMKVHWYKAVLLGSFQAQTVFILASLQMCWK